MINTAVVSAKLFLSGKLFQDTRKVLRQLAIGAGAGALAVILVSLFAPLWAAAVVGGAVSGFLQPILFKGLKYA